MYVLYRVLLILWIAFFFGVFFRNDWWICAGIAGYLTGLFCRKAFGHTEYTYWITTEQRKVCDYEAEHTLPPLCASLSPCTLTGMYVHVLVCV